MDGRDRLENHLRENGVVFGVQEHPTAYTAQKIAASEHVPGRMFAKVVMASTDGDLIMLVLAASSVVDVAKVSEVLGRQARLASEGEFASAFPDCEAGAMPPFGNLYDVAVYVDRAERADRVPGRDPHRDDERRVRGLRAPGASHRRRHRHDPLGG